MRAAILARSSSLDREGDRIESQVDECQAYAAARGYTVSPAHVFVEDNVSGRLDPVLRGPLQAAYGLLEAGDVQAIIVRDYSRLGRRLDTGQLVANSRQHGEGFIFARVPATEDKLGQMISDGAWSLISAIEAQVIFQRTSDGRRRSLEAGGVGCGDIPSYLHYSKTEGYRIDEEAAAPIRARLEAYERGESVVSICADADITTCQFYQSLDSPALAGRRYVWPLDPNPNQGNGDRRVWKRQRARERRRILRSMLGMTVDEADALARSAGLLKQEIPALVSWERWQGIVKLKAQRRRAPPAHRSLGMPFQGRMKCALCGANFVFSMGVNGRNTYLECSRRRKNRSVDQGVPKCTCPRFRYDAVEQAVAKQIAEWITNPDAIREAGEQYLADLDADIARLEIALGPVAGQLDKLRAKRARYAKLWGDGDISEEDWQRERERCDREIQRLEAQAEGTEETRGELEFVKSRADDIRRLLKGDFATSREAKLFEQLHKFVGRRLEAGQRSTLMRALERYDVKLLLGPEGVSITAAVLPEAIDVGGLDLSPSRWPPAPPEAPAGPPSPSSPCPGPSARCP